MSTLAGTDWLEAAVRSPAWGKVGQFCRPLRYAVTALADLGVAGPAHRLEYQDSAGLSVMRSRRQRCLPPASDESKRRSDAEAPGRRAYFVQVCRFGKR